MYCTPLLELRSITKRFPGVTALAEVSLTVSAGENHAICGESGAGKSTLVRILSGACPHGTYSGEIIFRGEPCRFGNVRASERAGIMTIGQEPTLIPELSITENLLLGAEPRRMGAIDWRAARRRAFELLREVGLRNDPDLLVRELSVARQQLVEIAKAIGRQARLLILDAPTAALSRQESAHLLGLIQSLKHRDISTILFSHDLAEIARIADRVTILRDGRAIETLDVDGHDGDEERIVRLRNIVDARSRGALVPAGAVSLSTGAI